jgi:hypothetical protein
LKLAHSRADSRRYSIMSDKRSDVCKDISPRCEEQESIERPPPKSTRQNKRGQHKRRGHDRKDGRSSLDYQDRVLLRHCEGVIGRQR